MANLKAGTLIGGNLIWSAGNLPLRVADSNIFINDTQIYTEKYKPTPAAIGAVNKAGDTMTGDLTMRKSNPEIWLHGDSNSSHCGKIYTVEGGNKDHGGWMGYDGNTNRMEYGYRANGSNGVVMYHAYNSNTLYVNGPVLSNASQSTNAASFTRKDYVDQQVATKVALGGSTMTGKLTLNYTSSVKVPVGPTSQRGSGVAGDFRFNSDEKGYEGFDGSEWQPIGSGRVAYTRFTANFTAVKGKGHLVDTTKAGIVATLPSGMNEADFVVIGDGAGNASKNPFYIAGYNGDRIVVNSDNCVLLFSWVSGKWVITNGIGESGAIDTANYLKKAGDTMNGDLKFAPGKKIILPTTDWATGVTIEALPAGDGFGANLNISSGGNTVLGAGESANNLRTLTNGENLYLTADGNIDLISGGNAWADRKTVRIANDGNMYLNYGATSARLYFGSTTTYAARSGDNIFIAANGGSGKVYIEGKTNPIARVGGTDYEIYHWGNNPTPSAIGAARVIGEWSTGTAANITTADFIKLLTDKGAFNDRYWVARGSWSYANNKTITDTGLGNIHLSGCVIEVISASANVYTIRITTPTTSTNGGIVNGEFIYVNNGSTYSPGWRRQYNTAYKPSAVDVGALSSSGGTVAGVISISEASTASRQFEAKQGTVTGVFRLSDAAAILGTQDGGSWTGAIKVGKSDFVYTPNASTWHKVYHQGFKPTAADVAALSTSGGTFSGDLISSSRNGGVFGTYDSTKTDQIWSIGTSYRNSADGSNFGNLYGLAYKYTNNTTGGYMAGGHQAVWCENGTPRSALGQHVWSSGRFISDGTGNVFESKGGFIRSDTVDVMSLDGKKYSFVTSPNDAHLCMNAYWDGKDWKKYDVSKHSMLAVCHTTGKFQLKASSPTSVNPNELTPMEVTHDGNLTAASTITASGHTIQVASDATNLHFWMRNSAGAERALMYHEGTTNTLNLRAGTGPRIQIFPNGRVASEAAQAGNAFDVLYERVGEGSAGFAAATNGGGWDSWRTSSTTLQASCPNALSSAHNIWKATQWNRAHLAAMSVHSPADGSVVVAMSVGVNGYNHFTYNSSGQGYAQGGWHTGSDARFKENIRPLSAQRTSWLDKVCALNASSFKYKTNDNQSIGFIAQNVQEIIPEAISIQIDTTKPEEERADTERLFIDPLAIIAAQNEAIKELVARIEALERK